jgi:F0F1-type ATP synthase delta subunit
MILGEKTAILSVIKTTQTLDQFVLDLEKYDEMLFKTSKKEKRDFEAYMDLRYENINKFYLSKYASKSFIELSKELVDLLTWLSQVDHFNLTLAFFPDGAFVNTLFTWCTGNIKYPVILNIEVDPNIIGGVVLNLKGKYIDYSLDKMLTEYFLVNKDAILSKLQK